MNILPEIDPSITVKHLLNRWPEASQVFFKRRMACVGCSLSAFDTLVDAARNYRLPVEQIIEEIAAVVGTVAQ